MPEMSDSEFARAALAAGLVTMEMVEECAIIQKRIKEMGLLPKGLKELMVEKGFVADDVARKISRGEQAEEAKKKERVVRIGGYEVISRLGKGQMGSVYKARQVSLDRIVALKVLPSRLAGDKHYLQRFLREAKAAGRLNHPNIVTAVAFGESDGLYYYAMDHVEGMNVGEILEGEGTLGEDEALAITLQMAKALQHAYENNIIHRDIKPENIMLDTEGRARLCDLGLAREANEAGAMTQAGIVLGTPYYVSPEQAEGRRDLDTRTDIYSLGVTLFHMVTGQVPFKGPTGPSIMVKHITDKMPDPREFKPDLSNGTVQLIRKMTAKDRGKRYQTPEGLIRDIERVIAGERPAAAGPVIRARKRRKPGERREEIVVKTGGGKKFIPLIAVGVIVLIVIVAIASMSDKKPVKRPPAYTGQPTSGTARTGGSSGSPDTAGGSTPVYKERPDTPREGLSIEQREIKQIMDWARTHQKETAEVARRYGEFIKTATDPKAIATARQALEGVAAREYISLQRKFESLLATGKIDGALNEATAYLKLFGGTGSAAKAALLLNRAKKERGKVIDKSITRALALAGEKKFSEALDLIAETADTAPRELKSKVSAARARIKKAQKDYLAASRARAEGSRAQFEGKLAAQIAALNLDGALSLINERVKIEVGPGLAYELRTKAADLVEARGALGLVVANLKNLTGLKQTFNIDRKGKETGTIERVKDLSFIFAAGAVTREVRINQLSTDDIVRLAQLNLGSEEAKARYQLGLLFLVVLDAPQEARKQLARAGELGMDTSRFEKKIAASKIEEMIAEAQGAERRRKYLDAAMTYSGALTAMAGLDGYTAKVKEVQAKIDSCLLESGAAKAFRGKVSIEKGKLVITYDFSNPGQWQDFKGYIWNEELKRPVEWSVEKGALVGKGAEAILWKGKFSGDVTLEVDATPKGPASPAFFLRLCDDGKGWKGKNYSFGFGFREKTLVGYRQKIVRGRRVREPQYRLGTPEILIMKWKGSASMKNKSTYIKRGVYYPSIKPGTTYKVKIERIGKRLRTTVNGTKLIEAEDKDYKKGWISLKVLNSVVRFDNLRITGDFDSSWLNRELRKAK